MDPVVDSDRRTPWRTASRRTRAPYLEIRAGRLQRCRCQTRPSNAPSSRPTRLRGHSGGSRQLAPDMFAIAVRCARGIDTRCNPGGTFTRSARLRSALRAGTGSASVSSSPKPTPWSVIATCAASGTFSASALRDSARELADFGIAELAQGLDADEEDVFRPEQSARVHQIDGASRRKGDRGEHSSPVAVEAVHDLGIDAVQSLRVLQDQHVDGNASASAWTIEISTSAFDVDDDATIVPLPWSKAARRAAGTIYEEARDLCDHRSSTGTPEHGGRPLRRAFLSAIRTTQPARAFNALIRFHSSAFGTVVICSASMQRSSRCGRARSASIALSRSAATLLP